MEAQAKIEWRRRRMRALLMRRRQGLIRSLITAGVLAILAAGCASSPPSPPNTVALMVRVAGGGTPSPQQITNIHQALKNVVENAGYRYAARVDAAAFLVHVTFTPNPADPGGGHVSVAGIEPRSAQAASGLQETSEAAGELRRRLREIERWEARQATTP